MYAVRPKQRAAARLRKAGTHKGSSGVNMVKIDFSKFSIADIEVWAQGTAGLWVDADSSALVVAML